MTDAARRPADNPLYAVSADGSRIAYERFGSGPPVILVGGALNGRNGRASGVSLARLLAPDFTAIAYDRRGRGDSHTTRPYSVEREVEDIAALVTAVGGSAALFGMSSGGALAVRAAAAGLNANAIALYEPPFNTDAAGEARAKTYDARLTELTAAGDDDAALALFLTMVGTPPPAIEGMRKGPGWKPLSALAPTLAHDSAVLDDRAGAPVPMAALAKITAPVLAIAGENSPPMLRSASEAVARAAAQRGSFRLLPGQTHDVAPAALAPVLAEFLRGK